MKIAKENITNYIPQRAPFVMIGNLVGAEETLLESDFLVEESNILCENGELSTPGLIENIAQTCAAGFGFLGHEKGEAPKGGFIGSISKMMAHSCPKIGELVETKVSVVTQFENIVLIKGESFSNGTPLLECEMKIVIVD